MFQSYLKIAFRSLRKNKLVSFINIFGLGLSMSLGLMIMIRLQDSLSFDRFHPHPEKIFRITSDYQKKTGERWPMASTPLPLYNRILNRFGSVENIVSIYPAFQGKGVAEGKEFHVDGAFTESSLFQVFGFRLSAGDPSTALTNPNSLVIAKPVAEKFFAGKNPIGKVVRMDDGSVYIVTGVLEDLPGKSHLNYEVYASFSSVKNIEKNKLLPGRSEDWFAFNAGYTYVRLKAGASIPAMNSELAGVSAELNKINDQGTTTFTLQPLRKITPGDERLYHDNSGSSWAKLYFEVGIAFIVLLAACFNYTNLTTARALTRAKEVGIRKVTGARRSQIFAQYITESVFLSFLALLLAWVLLGYIVQYAPFNDGYEFIPSSFQYNRAIFLWSGAFAVFTGLLAGTAPAWILSSFTPVRVLKNLSTAKIFGKVSLQKTLIVFQYSLSLVVIIFLFAFFQQFRHLAAADPGFKRDNVAVVSLNGLDQEVATARIAALGGVSSVGAMSSVFGAHFSGMNTDAWAGHKSNKTTLRNYYANAAFIRDMHLVILAGRNFLASDGLGQERSIILNEKAVLDLGFKEAGKAIGHFVWMNDSTRLEIAGVVRDFHYENAGVAVAPVAFRDREKETAYLYVSTDGSDKAGLLTRIRETMVKMGSQQPVTASWLNEDLDRNNAQTATISLLAYIAFMVLAIATLGLTGLVVYTVEVKRKEISVRKILGAEQKQIVRILSGGFIRLLLIAGCIAVPLGYAATHLFLQNFVDRASFGWNKALTCFVFLLTIGLITILSHTWRAAKASPIKDLRTE